MLRSVASVEFPHRVREASMCALDELTRHLAADEKSHLIAPTL